MSSLNIISRFMKSNNISEDEAITAAVTSPPYYNAREYSQRPNLYLKDMYNIIIQSDRVLKKDFAWSVYNSDQKNGVKMLFHFRL